MISSENITFAYGKNPILQGLSFRVREGEWRGLLGPNGSGKTTLIKCLSRLLRPQTGEIALNDRPLQKFEQGELARIVAVVPQDSNILFPFTAFEIVLMGRSPHKSAFGFENAHDVAIAKDVMESTGTWEFKDRLIQELSAGERQRVIIARALAQEPKVLLMDEPTSFLDIKHQQEILSIIKMLNKDKGLTVISAMHDINVALAYCENIMFLKKGSLVKAGPAGEVVTYANLKDVFETEVYVGINDLSGRPFYLPGEGVGG